MKQSRMIGNLIRNRAEEANITSAQLSKTAECSEDLIEMFLDGRALLSYEKLKRISQRLNISMNQILEGDEEEYNRTVVHCMNSFDDNNQREHILDLIDGYLDVKESLSGAI